MVSWNFNAQEVKEVSFEIAPVGETRLKILEVKERVSSKGNDMWEFTLKPSGGFSNIFYYLVFDPTHSEMVNTNLSNLWKSLGLKSQPNTNIDLKAFENQILVAKIRHTVYNDTERAEIHYFLDKEKKKDLPAYSDKPVAKQEKTVNPFENDDIQF